MGTSYDHEEEPTMKFNLSEMGLSKNHQVIARLVNLLGTTTKSKLGKLLFLADVLCKTEHGKRLTTFKYYYYFFGPYPDGADQLINELKAYGFLKFVEHKTDEGDRYFTVEWSEDRKMDKLSDSACEEALATVVEEHKGKRLNDLATTCELTLGYRTYKFGDEVEIK